MQLSTEVSANLAIFPNDISAFDRTRLSCCVSLTCRVRVFIAVICLWFSVAITAAAQDSSVPDSKDTKPIPIVVTTVEVKGTLEPDYAPEASTVGAYKDVPLKDAPQSILSVTRGVMDNQQARVLSDITRNDASIGEDYAPVGYYQDFQIRGFPIDLATGLKINGLTIAGEQLDQAFKLCDLLRGRKTCDVQLSAQLYQA